MTLMQIRSVCIRDFNVVVNVFEFNLAKTDSGDGRCTQCADVLRVLDGFNSVSRDVGENLAYDVYPCKPSGKTDGVGNTAFFRLAFEHPTEMEADAFDYGAEQIASACFEV